MAATHPSGISVTIVGIEAATSGRSCEEHDICGSVLQEDVVVRIRKVQVLIDGSEESALAVYWVSDGIDRCRVGFLQKHLVKHWKNYDGRLAQVTELFKGSDNSSKRKLNHKNKGSCTAVLIDAVRAEQEEPPTKRQRGDVEEEAKEESKERQEESNEEAVDNATA